MRRRPVHVVALILAGVVATAIAVGVVVWAVGDEDPPGRAGPEMMGPSSTPHGRDGSPSSGRGMHGTDGPGGPAGSGEMAMAVSESEYLAEMVAHHREAVDAARQLVRSDRPEMRAFGESIVRTQSAQIEQMQTWLRTWHPDQPAAEYEPMMGDLSELSGERLDQVFLEDMIGHHMHAVMTSQHLLMRGAEHDEVAALARTIRDDQHTEILQMRRWREQWFAEDGSPN